MDGQVLRLLGPAEESCTSLCLRFAVSVLAVDQGLDMDLDRDVQFYGVINMIIQCIDGTLWVYVTFNEPLFYF